MGSERLRVSCAHFWWHGWRGPVAACHCPASQTALDSRSGEHQHSNSEVGFLLNVCPSRTIHKVEKSFKSGMTQWNILQPLIISFPKSMTLRCSSIFFSGSAVKNPPAKARDTSVGVGNGNPLQHSCLENFMERGAWRTTIHGVAKSQTQLSMSPHTGRKKHYLNFVNLYVKSYPFLMHVQKKNYETKDIWCWQGLILCGGINYGVFFFVLNAFSLDSVLLMQGPRFDPWSGN